MTQWDINNDRRRNFRIEEKASVGFRIVADCSQPLDTLFPPSSQFSLLTDLRQLDEEAESSLRRVSEEDKSIATYLRMLNRKIDRIAHTLANPDNERHLNAITLSEGGLSLLSKKPLQAGTLLAIRLQLLPEGSGILCFARTVYSLEMGQERHRIGVEFIDLDDRNRHTIARHLMETQARLRRQSRDQDTLS
ncbi:MAG: PilZ domain-containing protein [Motiliproteus sp.]|nr:PilZ domain-containing protein [Motiliproteus sp.]MCW9051795.1 PilZ domain-containing protein [Motiliproteus sp.]